MSKTAFSAPRWPVNRRAFLRGATGVALGLPFLESLPERSAWAAGHAPVFSLFICAVDGIVPSKFFPNALGELTTASLAAAEKATSVLSPHAENLLFVRGISWPSSATSDAHAQSLCQALTALPPVGGGNQATSTGPSADWVIARKVQGATPPLTLYAGRKAGYINEKLSFSAAGTVTAASNNPYELYQKLVGLVSADGTPAPGAEEAKRLLFESRKSIHDLVRDDLRALMTNPRMSMADRQRLQQHFDSVRDMEITMGDMGDAMVKGCAWGGVEISKLEALKTFIYSDNGMIEDIARLQMSLVALAFACNYNRTATLQWGDGTDGTVYPVPSNESLKWKFNFICHRAPSDSAAGDNPTAAQAHAEIDALRMKTLAAGLEHFKARGLADKSFVLWTNAIADCPSDSFRNVPIILWGNGGGYLKQGAYVDAGSTTNSPLLNALISAAIQDTGETMENFGAGPSGQLAAVLA
ncbi:MAG TPA: DUF1552 domain-containing protein [Polyangiaceae bacterium]|nr:DUF1552 domain-containing protein [Polyangiaceae bacterium]